VGRSNGVAAADIAFIEGSNKWCGRESSCAGAINSLRLISLRMMFLPGLSGWTSFAPLPAGHGELGGLFFGLSELVRYKLPLGF
jgi:hypothetical protein